MPGNKRPRKPKHLVKRKKTAEQLDDGSDPNLENTQEIAKSYGSQKSTQSLSSPSMTRGSARSR